MKYFCQKALFTSDVFIFITNKCVTTFSNILMNCFTLKNSKLTTAQERKRADTSAILEPTDSFESRVKLQHSQLF